MVFFRATPNVEAGERARIDYFACQLATALGEARTKLPSFRAQDLLSDKEPDTWPEKIGAHLSYDTRGLHLEEKPESLQQCGGGG